ncbi:MAG: ribosome silencing factor [Bryobacterales bacterium]|nr:ribosome silencing factor [Bryobacterales bacterium]
MATTKKSAAISRVRKKLTAGASAAKAPRSNPAAAASQVVTEEMTAWLPAVRAMEAKKAGDIKVLDLRAVTTFTDYLLICSGSNPRQIQAIADEAGKQLKDAGERPQSVEGYDNAEWVLLDYGDFVVNVFSEKAREYYDLERLWRDAAELPIPAA